MPDVGEGGMHACERRQQHAYCEKGAYILLEREGSTHAVCEKRTEPCLLIEPGKWWSELEEANAHMLAHVFTSRCMHTACRHTDVTAHDWQGSPVRVGEAA